MHTETRAGNAKNGHTKFVSRNISDVSRLELELYLLFGNLKRGLAVLIPTSEVSLGGAGSRE